MHWRQCIAGSLSHRDISYAAGLSDERQRKICATLRHEAEGLAGSMMLGHLCETVRDLLTALNSPDGDCIFCRCALLDEPAQGTSCSHEDQLYRLPCYHVYHMCAVPACQSPPKKYELYPKLYYA